MSIAEGNVLGIDVGWSEKQESSAVCRLSWNKDSINWRVCRFRANDDDRRNTIHDVAGTNKILAVAIDGPLRRNFDEIERYRSAERVLSRGELLKRIGKPGQSSSPNGKKLNWQANLAATTVKDWCEVGDASHDQAIDEYAVVEAFPTSFLGVMVRCPERLSAGERSDRYFGHLDGHEGPDRSLSQLIECLLGPKSWEKHIHSLTNHDDRAAFVCAITGLCIACGEYTAVGDSRDGWIILPPKWAFEEWAWEAIVANLKREQGERHRKASLLCYEDYRLRAMGEDEK
ncbi:MAG: hypothetical protein OXP09_12315 [Gammaproteobacteria bacterium]|nr:hypothetical protein [Gammaproteobacteria bacterium]